MFIKRVCAPNLREAMHEVREALGSNAVILSNRRVSQGIEIVAATDYNEELFKGNQKILAKESATMSTGDPNTGDPNAGEPNTSSDFPEADSDSTTPAQAQGSKPLADFVKTATHTTDSIGSGPKTTKPRIVWSQDPMLVDMQKQIKAIHELLEQQLSGLARGELARHQPQRTELLERLMDFGLSNEMCLKLAEQATSEQNLDRAWKLAMESLTQALPTTNDDILTRGGIVALVGPTGVGKTTTVAKLAARYILRHGQRQVALITTDSYRIGAFEQLSTFGMILDVPVRLVKNHLELQAAIDDFASKSLILIDTAGMSQRDMRLSEQLSVLQGALQIRSYVVLAANSQTAVLEEAVAAFKTPLAGCILTKVDEACRLGGALSVIHRSELPLAYVSNGQRVPEELQAAGIEDLVRLGEQLADSDGKGTEDEALALAFGKEVANAHF